MGMICVLVVKRKFFRFFFFSPLMPTTSVPVFTTLPTRWSPAYVLFLGVLACALTSLCPLLVVALPLVPVAHSSSSSDPSRTPVSLAPLVDVLHPALSLALATVPSMLLLACFAGRIPKAYEGELNVRVSKYSCHTHPSSRSLVLSRSCSSHRQRSCGYFDQHVLSSDSTVLALQRPDAALLQSGSGLSSP